MRNLFLLGVSPVKPVIVQDEAGEEPEQEVENSHDCTEHHFAIVFEHSREPDSKDDNVKDDAEQVDSKSNRYWLRTSRLGQAPDETSKKEQIGEEISLKKCL